MDILDFTRTGPRARRVAFGVLASLPVVAFAPAASAQAVYTGSQVKIAADSSLDILKDHVQFQATQDRYDAMLGYVALSDRFSPLTYANADGTKTSGLATRAATMIGGGWGSTSGFGFYVGAWSDIVKIGPNGDSAIQGLVFGGLAAYGFQATYAGFVGFKLQGVDDYGNFTGGTSHDAYTYVPGSGVNHAAVGGPKDAFSIYHSSGASLVILRRSDPSQPGTPTVVSEVRAQLQPLKPWLTKEVGLPMVAIQRLRSTVDAWSNPRELLASATGGTPDLPDPTKKPVEVELGGDDLLGRGIRLHGLARVSPDVRFRMEAGAYRDFSDRLTAAFRSFVFARDGGVTASFDGFFQAAIIPEGPKGNVGFPISAAVSYSYNSPESSTFVPLPWAHVIGLQVILGVPDVAKRVVPIVRAKTDAKPPPTSPSAPPAADGGAE